MRLLTKRVTPWQTIEVWGDRFEREFRVTGAIHAWWGRSHFLTGLAWDNIAAGILSHPGEIRSVLMLGLGGGTSLRTLRHLLPDISLTAVEIDPDIIALAREYMHLDETGAEIITADAYHWLRTNRRRFDVIFDDVYGVTAKDVARPSALTDSILRDIRRGLEKEGIVGVNLVLGPGHRRMQTAFRRRLGAAFPEVRSITTEASLNECLAAGPRLRPWRDIRALAGRFPSDTDYSFWRRLRARRLRVPEPDGSGTGRSGR